MTTELRPLEAESAVAGAILIDPTCLRVIKERIRPADMVLAINQAIYRAALELERQDKHIDSVTIKDQAAKDGEELDGAALVSMMDTTPTAANAAAYADMVREASVKRSLARICEETKAKAATADDPQAILADTARQIEELRQEGTCKTLLSPEDQILAFYDHREQVESGQAAAVVKTGYRDIDHLLGGGMLNGGMYLIAARPGIGKTTLALNIVRRVTERRETVLFVSLEMDNDQLTAKRAAMVSGINYNKLLMQHLDEGEYAKLAEAMDALHTQPFYSNDMATMTVAEIEELAGRTPHLKLIVVDYFGLIQPSHRASRMDATPAATETSKSIKQLARKFKVPVLLLSQLNREVEKRPDKHPQLSDLRDTGSLEQDADGVMLLYRPSYYDKEKVDGYSPVTLEVHLAKNRHGATGRTELAYALAPGKIMAQSNDPREVYRRSMREE